MYVYFNKQQIKFFNLIIKYIFFVLLFIFMSNKWLAYYHILFYVRFTKRPNNFLYCVYKLWWVQEFWWQLQLHRTGGCELKTPILLLQNLVQTNNESASLEWRCFLKWQYPELFEILRIWLDLFILTSCPICPKYCKKCRFISNYQSCDEALWHIHTFTITACVRTYHPVWCSLVNEITWHRCGEIKTPLWLLCVISVLFVEKNFKTLNFAQ